MQSPHPALEAGCCKSFLQHTDAVHHWAYRREDQTREGKDVGAWKPKFDDMPHVHNPTAAEDKILSGIEEIDVLKERYRQACEYLEWFIPAWGQLSEEEQYLLKTFYSDTSSATGAVYDICDRFRIERSSAYNKKNRALEHLQVLLFGKE